MSLFTVQLKRESKIILDVTPSIFIFCSFSSPTRSNLLVYISIPLGLLRWSNLLVHISIPLGLLRKLRPADLCVLGLPRGGGDLVQSISSYIYSFRARSVATSCRSSCSRSSSIFRSSSNSKPTSSRGMGKGSPQKKDSLMSEFWTGCPNLFLFIIIYNYFWDIVNFYLLTEGSRDQVGLKNITTVARYILQAKLVKETRGEVKKVVVDNFIIFWNTQ